MNAPAGDRDPVRLHPPAGVGARLLKQYGRTVKPHWFANEDYVARLVQERAAAE